MENQIFLDSVVRAQPGMAFLVDPQGRVCMTNTAANALCGGDPDDFLASGNFHDLETKARLVGLNAPLERLRHGAPEQNPVLVGDIDSQGTERVLAFQLGPPVSGGYRLGTVMVVSDWIDRLYHAVSRDQAATGVELDLSDVAHSLGNIFGIVQMASEALVRTGTDPNIVHRAEHILRCSEQGNDLVGRLGGLAARSRDRAARSDVGVALRSACDMFGRLFPGAPAVALPDPSGAAPDTVMATGADLEAACLDMLNLARVTIPLPIRDGSQVRVAAAAQDGTVTITVARVAPGGTDKIAVSSQRQDVMEIADKLGAFAADHDGRFTFAPDWRQLDLALPAAVPVFAALQSQHGQLDGYNLLLAEADPLLSRELDEALRARGASVTRVSSGAECLSRAWATPAFDAVLVNPRTADLMSSADIATALMARPPAPRIIVLSSTAGRNLLPDGRRYGMRLFKALDAQILSNAIKLVPAIASAPGGYTGAAASDGPATVKRLNV